MRSLALSVLVLALAPVPARAIETPVRTDGRWLEDARGRTLVVHGVQIAHKRPPHHPPRAQFGPPDAARIAALGLDVVRVPWFWSAYEPRRGRRRPAYLRELAREVRLLADRGVLSLVEAHQDVYARRIRGVGFPDWAVRAGGARAGPPRRGIDYGWPAADRAFASLYRDRDGLARSFARAWRDVAAALAPERAALLGYDLVNEPWPGGAGRRARCDRGCPGWERRVLAPFQDRLARAVRAVDATTPVFYEPQQLFDFGARSGLRPPPWDVRPAALAFHAYCAARPGRVLHADAESSSPGWPSCRRELGRVFDRARETARRMRVPALLDEFGDTADPGLVAAALDRADRERIGWVYWAYKDWDDVPGGAGDGSLFADDRRDATYLPARAALLARAYPEATAGEPLAWRWDAARRTFALSIRPDRAVCAPSVVSVPVRVHYPRGYSTSVVGGSVVSAPNAARLLVQSAPGARRVEVRVYPAG